MKGKNQILFRYIAIISITILGIMVATIRCSSMIRKSFHEQLEQNLKDVAIQNADALQRQIYDRYDLLQNVAEALDVAPNRREQLLDTFVPMTKAFHIKRIGFCDETGLAHATDGSATYLAHREFFQKGMQGQNWISDVLEDAMDDKHEFVTVMSMPIHSESGEINGIAAMTFETAQLNEELSTNSFEGMGDSFVISQRGQVILTSNPELMNISDNIFSEILNKEKRNEKIVPVLMLNINKQTESRGTLYLNGQPYYYQLLPVSLMDGCVTWYVVTIIPTNYMQNRFYPVRNHLTKMVILVSLLCLFCALWFRWFTLKQRRLAYSLAFESQLTGGPNLVKFLQDMAVKDNPVGYLVVMNIEKFSLIQSTAGKEKSEKLLQEIWQIICQMHRTEEISCHDKADSFVLYMRDSTTESVEERLEWLHDCCYQAASEMHIPWVNPRFGIILLEQTESVEDAYHKANVAIHEARRSEECYSFYDEETYKFQVLNQNLEDHFDAAIKNREFEVFYQPKYNINGQTLSGCEALVRWRDSEGGLISPGIFIPIFERNGKISKLDAYVFDRVCEQQRAWLDQGMEVVPVSVNLSGASLYRNDVMAKYMKILDDYHLDPKYVQLEVTETILSRNDYIVDLLRHFRERGIRILMDDFGTGYSSLATLNLKCFDVIKIDKSLVDIACDEFGKILLAKSIDLGRSLGLKITVEGVETEEQYRFLKYTGCDDIQGYYFSKPLPKSEFEKLLK